MIQAIKKLLGIGWPSKDCRIWRVDRDHHVYERFGRSVRIYTELQTKDIDFIIQLSYPYFWSDGAPVTNQERESMKINFISYMEYRRRRVLFN